MKSLGICVWCATLGAFWGGLTACGFAEEAALCRCAADTSPNTRRILEILSQPLKSDGFEFKEEPLESITSFLQEEYGIPIQFDDPALDDCGLTRDEPVTVRIHNVSLRSALRVMFESKQLDYLIRNEVLYITTPQAAEAKLLTCVYDIRDLNSFLTRPAQNGRPAPDYDALIDAIISCVAPETWAEAGGGEAEIRPLPPGLLVVSQTRSVHEEVAALLATIRETLQLPVSVEQVKPEASEGMERNEGGLIEKPKSLPALTPTEETPFD